MTKGIMLYVYNLHHSGKVWGVPPRMENPFSECEMLINVYELFFEAYLGFSAHL